MASDTVTPSAVVVVDVQHGLCTGRWAMSGIEHVIGRINDVIDRARAAGVPVVFVQHEGAGLPHGGGDWSLDARLAVRTNDPRVRKTAPDAFHRTGFDDLLKSLGVERLVVCGLQSEFCVDSTVRAALAHGYAVTLLTDAHATMDNGVLTADQIAAHHNVTLAGIDSFVVRVTAVPAAHWLPGSGSPTA